jgi:hypothetical protein
MEATQPGKKAEKNILWLIKSLTTVVELRYVVKKQALTLNFWRKGEVL